MPTINIDGKEYEFEGNPALIPFCKSMGIEIPYFCYHPGMSTPTNCRMCMIDLGFHAKDRATGEMIFEGDGSPKIMWGRKPATACNTRVGPGMFVKTGKTSDVIKLGQKGVLELMLLNHPLDCPICDQAGECPLQMMTYKYGPEGSRFEEQKGHKPKRLPLGPNVILDAERCINCTRCVRFTEEVSKSFHLTIIGRGEKNLPSCAPGQPFDDPYSMNTIDLCPVGALTSREHRFKARVWEMAAVESIDMNDSTGSNIFVWVRDNKVMRITPRENLAINDYWIPDAHRLNTDYYNADRVSGIHLLGEKIDARNEGLGHAAQLLKKHKGKILFLGSPYASLGSNYMLGRLAKDWGVEEVFYVSNIQEGFGDDWLMQDDRTPNAAACEQEGFKAVTVETLASMMKSGDYDCLYALENDWAFGQLEEAAQSIDIIAHGHNWQAAYKHVEVLFAAADILEAEGIYINYKGIPQAAQLGRKTQQMPPEMWMRLPKSRLDKGAYVRDKWRNDENIFDVQPSWFDIAHLGQELQLAMPFESHPELFKKLKEVHHELLADLHISYKVPKSAFKTTQIDYAQNW